MRIRPAAPSDALALADVQVRAWREAYRGKLPAEYLDGLDPAQRRVDWDRWIGAVAAPAAILVLDHETEGVVGFVAVGAGRDPDTDPRAAGEIVAICVRPTHWGSGGGRMLMAAAERHLADAGFGEAVLWVLDTNERARRFYEAGGWRADGSVKTDSSLGFPMALVRYRRYGPSAEQSGSPRTPG